MKSIASVTLVAVVIACAMAMAPQNFTMKAGVSQGDSVATYEHLATAIIAIRKTEDSLVHGMLMNSLTSARTHLNAAAKVSGTDRRQMLESAAAEITDLANEGNKQIQAIRQRLLKAGHHHHTDSETQEDYIFIDSKEKGALLALAGKVARMRQASPDDIHTAAAQLTELAKAAMKPE